MTRIINRPIGMSEAGVQWADMEGDIELGGAGSGNRGHKGRPGHRGGSAPGEGVSVAVERSRATVREVREACAALERKFDLAGCVVGVEEAKGEVARLCWDRAALYQRAASGETLPPEMFEGAMDAIDKAEKALADAQERLERAVGESQAEAVKLIAEAAGPGSPDITRTLPPYCQDDDAKAIDKGVEFVRKVVRVDLPISGVTFSKDGKGGRPYYEDGTNKVTLPMYGKARAIAVVHELGHWLEDVIPGAGARSLAFLKRRTEGERLVTMTQATGDRGYHKSEVTKTDKFLSPYMGRHYKASDSGRTATEILSMGMEFLATNAATLASRDPDYFEFVLVTVWGVDG